MAMNSPGEDKNCKGVKYEGFTYFISENQSYSKEKEED
jgi:hypothetical protein